jgi:hypothetical protein
MKKFNSFPWVLVLLIVGLFLTVNFGLAQGMSPVNVNKITVSPLPFKVGERVTISLELENTATGNYGCVGGVYYKAFIHIFKAKPFTVDNVVWETSQALTAPFRPGEKRTVTFTSTWTVPNTETINYFFSCGSPVCAPDEFGQHLVVTYYRSCVYNSLQVNPEIIRLSVKELYKLIKK